MASQDTKSGATEAAQAEPVKQSDPATVPGLPSALQYTRLSAEFETHERPDGLSYITGEQCISRLNDVLGPAGWQFEIVAHGHQEEKDEIWVEGRLTAWFQGVDRPVYREQFGSQEVKRASGDGKLAAGTILDYGFDLKGAATDALKKCATGIGVGLYLTQKEHTIADDDNRTFICEVCDEVLTSHTFPSGDTWSAGKLANYGKSKHRKILCWIDYLAFNEAKKAGRPAPTEPAPRRDAQAPASQAQQGQRPPAGASPHRQPAQAQPPAQRAAGAPAAPAPKSGETAPAQPAAKPADIQQHRERTDREWWATYQRARASHVKAGLGELEQIDQSQVNRTQLREMCDLIKRKIELAQAIDALCGQHVDEMERVDGALLNLENLSESEIKARYTQIEQLLTGTTPAADATS